jgi:Intein splicing domain
MIDKLTEVFAQLENLPPQTRVKVVRGFELRLKANGIPVGRIHYSADPDRDPATPLGTLWYDAKRKEYDSNHSGWDREYEIVDEAGGGERIFSDILTRYGQKIIIRDPKWMPSPEWGIVGGFDHGGTNPTCLLKCYIDNDGNRYFAGEYYAYKTKVWDNTISSNARAITGMELDENKKLVPAKTFDASGKHNGYVEKMPGLDRMRWINGDPSIFWDTVPTPEGQLVAAAAIYAGLGLRMRSFSGERNDLAFVQRLQDDLWGNLHSQAPKVYIVCRNESDARQPGMHPYDCPNLVWELRRIRRQELTARALLTQNPTEKIVDKDNHCLVAGTGIATLRGSLPIEDVAVGDFVLTRNGWKKVARSWQSLPSAEIFKVTFSDGRRLYATANHPIWVDGKFVRVDELKYGMVAVCQSTVSPKLDSGWASTSTDTPTAPTATSEDTFATEASICTRWSGFLSISARSLTAIISTTLTKIASTTSRTISRQRSRLTTFAGIARSLEASLDPQSKPLRFGIAPQKEKLGTANRLGRSLARLSKKIALNVAFALPTRIERRETLFAGDLAGLGGVMLTTSMMKPETAAGAEYHSRQSSTLKLGTARGPVRVLAVEKMPYQRPVYDLSVEDTHEFFANGILVHNSWDTFKYVNMQFPRAEPLPVHRQVANLIKDLNPMSAQIAAERFISRLGKGSRLSQYDMRNKKRMGR